MPSLILARRFVLAGLLLLLSACLVVGWLAVSQLGETALYEAQARARLVAEEMAGQVHLAVNVGVPVDRLVGVEDLFEHRMASFPGIVRAALLDTNDQVLHERRTSSTHALPPATIPIVHEGVPVARLELQWRAPSLTALLLPWGIPLLAVIALTTGLAGEAFRFALTGLVLRRDRLVQASCERIATGDLTTRPPRLDRRDFDNRLLWLTEQLRHVGEQRMRVSRLAQSLRQTEPDFDKRRQIDQILADALRDGKIALPESAESPDAPEWSSPTEKTPSEEVSSPPFLQTVSDMPASSQAALQRWRGVILGVLPWALIAMLAGNHFAWVCSGSLAFLALMLWVAGKLQWWQKTFSGWYGALLGGLVFGPCLGLLMQIAWTPQHFLALGKLGYLLLAGLSVCALVLPWLGEQANAPDLASLPIAQEKRTHAA